MGTSSLYKGPKKTILLPDDYTDGTADQQSSSTQEDVNLYGANNYQQQNVPSVTWKAARNSISKSAGQGGAAIKRAASSYTKALGGHRNAAKQATIAKATTTAIISFFSGSPSEIRERFENAGISFENKTTKEIFLEIRDVISPIPNTIEDGYVNNAVTEAFCELLKDEALILENIDDALNESLLQRLACGTIKYYIYTKLINQATLGILKNKTTVEVQLFEREARQLVEGIVNAVVPEILTSGVKNADIKARVNEIFEGCYKVMEGL